MKMNPRIVLTKLNASLPSLSLLAILLAACAPGATQPAAVPPPVVVELPSATPFLPADPSLGLATPLPAVVEAPTQAALPVATSRGPDLEATDPTTVSLASGQYQFVEFFRFT